MRSDRPVRWDIRRQRSSRGNFFLRPPPRFARRSNALTDCECRTLRPTDLGGRLLEQRWWNCWRRNRLR